jgi:hypothetical protein
MVALPFFFGVILPVVALTVATFVLLLFHVSLAEVSAFPVAAFLLSAQTGGVMALPLLR